MLRVNKILMRTRHADLLHGELVAEPVRPHQGLSDHLWWLIILIRWLTKTLSKEALMVTLSPGRSATLARPAKLYEKSGISSNITLIMIISSKSVDHHHELMAMIMIYDNNDVIGKLSKNNKTKKLQKICYYKSEIRHLDTTNERKTAHDRS